MHSFLFILNKKVVIAFRLLPLKILFCPFSYTSIKYLAYLTSRYHFHASLDIITHEREGLYLTNKLKIKFQHLFQKSCENVYLIFCIRISNKYIKRCTFKILECFRIALAFVCYGKLVKRTSVQLTKTIMCRCKIQS